MQIRGVVLWLINPAESRLTVQRRESRAKSGRDVKVKGCVTWSRALAGELIKASSTLRSWWTIDDGQGCCRDTPMIHLLLLLLARWMLSRSSASLPLDLPFSFSLALWSPCLGFTYLGHSSCTMSLCRYFRQRACLGELSLVRLPPFQGGYGARSEFRWKSRGKHHFRIVSRSNRSWRIARNRSFQSRVKPNSNPNQYECTN